MVKRQTCKFCEFKLRQNYGNKIFYCRLPLSVYFTFNIDPGKLKYLVI